MNIIKNITLGLTFVSSLLFPTKVDVPIQTDTQNLFGASTQSSEVRALFTTTLASKITSSDTSMTLSSASDKEGTTLASSTYGFIIDEGTSKEELVLADCTGTTCTNMTRGLSVKTGTTSVSSLKYEHGRGAEVKITDAPALIFATNVFRGKQNLEYKLRYNSSQTFNDSNDIISRSYADALSFGAVPASSETASGFVELATGIEAASSTSSGGTGARLALPASLATSSYNNATAALRVVVTKNDGKIDENFLPSSIVQTSTNNTFTGINTFSTSTATSTVIGSMPAYWIGKNIQVISTTGTSTFTVPSGINKIKVRAVGGGGGGSGVNYVNSSGGGGGGGGYAEEMIDVTGTSTIQVFVGNGGTGGSTSAGNSGTWSTFGTNGFYLYAQGGSPGSGGSGGAGGCGVSADINSCGGGGAGGVTTAAGPSGAGGSTALGGGGAAVSGQTSGSDGKVYGGGGSGGSESGSSSSGGNGAQGVVIITW